MLKLLQARLQHYVNRELPDVQAGFRKGRGIRDQIANIHFSSVQFSSVHFSRSVVSDSLRPHRQQPIRFHRPWDSPGKNTRVGCHFLLPAMAIGLKKSVFILIPRKGSAKNDQTKIQPCSFHMLARLCLISFKLSFSSM